MELRRVLAFKTDLPVTSLIEPNSELVFLPSLSHFKMSKDIKMFSQLIGIQLTPLLLCSGPLKNSVK